jgi:hypothetical protein
LHCTSNEKKIIIIIIMSDWNSMPLGDEKTTRQKKERKKEKKKSNWKISPSTVYNMTNDELTPERFHVHTHTEHKNTRIYKETSL